VRLAPVPRFQLRSLPPTPIETLIRAREIALKQGLYYVYIGNVLIEGAENGEMNIKEGKCKFCGTKIKGVWS